MTQRYKMTRAIKKGELVYKCVNCGPNHYYLKDWNECIPYPIPTWITNRALCSGGICQKTWENYQAKKNAQNHNP